MAKLLGTKSRQGQSAKMLKAIVRPLPQEVPDPGSVPAVLGILDTFVFTGDQARASAP